MNVREKMQCGARARILKALAHPSRMYIIQKLGEKPYCVHELTDMIGADASTVSRHLSVLKNAGIVVSDKKRQTVYYILAAPCILNFLDCIEKVIRQTLRQEYAYLLEKKGRSEKSDEGVSFPPEQR